MIGPSSDSGRTLGPFGSVQRILPTLIVLTGAGLLLSSIFLGWYVVQAASPINCTNVSETLSPTGVVVASTGMGCPSPESGSYASAGLPATGSLLGIIGALAALSGGISLVIAGRLYWARGKGVSRALLMLSIAAIGVGVLGPALLVGELPSTICQDQGFIGTPFATAVSPTPAPYVNTTHSVPLPSCNGWSFWHGSGPSWSWVGSSGPWNSFSGGTIGGSGFGWGPGVGWGADIMGVWLVGVGVFLARRDLVLGPPVTYSARRSAQARPTD